MIGVVAGRADDLDTAGEFFELFKTPWEPAVPARRYRAVLCADGHVPPLDADRFLVYGSGEAAVDREAGMPALQVDGPVVATWGEAALPIYGRVALFDGERGDRALSWGAKVLGYRHHLGSRGVRRVGYDLFQEVRHLLTEGQPARHAPTPTLELHVALLRHLLLDSGVPFVEVPPRPDGLAFTCCLTHDVDFFGIRRHRLDRTMMGFLARASIGTFAELLRGRRPVADALRNWAAVLSLPLVLLGARPDFWHPFDDYARADGGRPSTFFLVPFKGRPGSSPNGAVEPGRAAPYGVADIQEEARAAAAHGAELAVHGLDAWRDADAGREELGQLTALTGRTAAGVRVHWLYFAGDSPRRLEAAGFDYDSTCGYNETIGYRAGTAQVFRLPGSDSLLELPLVIMDSAMFFPGRLALTRDEALRRCRQLVAHARRFGGTLVINWHDRSLAPERLWGRAYRELLDAVGAGDRIWFATAGEAVEWFRWRRSIRFAVAGDPAVVTVAGSAARAGLPAGVVEIHRPGAVSGGGAESRRFDGRQALTLSV